MENTTALTCCFLRAYHEKNNSVRVFSDPAAEKLLGKHDFSAFMASGSSVTDTVRTLTTLHVERDGAYVKVTAAADGFLYNMVRILTGTLLGAAAGSIDVNDIPKILASGDRSASGATAPAHGLYLSRVFYAEEPVFEAD